MEGWSRLIGVESLKNLFDQVLGVYLSERSEKKWVRPFPVLTSNGQPLELFKLYWIVRKIGGYDSVSSKRLWDYVADFCGLDIGAVGSVKLIYVKYLTEFDHWLRELVNDGSVGGGEGGVVRQLDLLSKKLETMFRSSLPHSGQEKKETNYPSINGCKEELICKVNSQVDFEMFTAESVNEINDGEHRMPNLCNGVETPVSKTDEGTVFVVSTEGVVEEVLYPAESKRQHDDDNDEKFVTQNGKIYSASTNKVMQDVVVSRKRKREASCVSGVLDWISYVARHCKVPEIGDIPNSSKCKGHTSAEYWSKVLLIRKKILEKESNPQTKKKKMNPFMYNEEKTNSQPAEKVRFSTRIPIPKRHILCQGYTSGPISQKKGVTHKKREVVAVPDIKGDADLVEVPVTQKNVRGADVVEVSVKQKNVKGADVVEVSVTQMNEDRVDQPTHVEPLVGPLYQAEVPEWTGVLTESDSKWLGTRMWPPEVEKTAALVVSDPPIGKGRPSACDCIFPGSVECIRFHIAEKRTNLKFDLGPLFFHWRFHRMGEEVSLSWTAAEEQRFKDSISSTSRKNLWKNYKKLFPSKTWNILASYYFNVFLVKRRRYQNRVTPKDLDSDDDEKGFGCIGGGLGDSAVHVPNSRSSLICFHNKASGDLV
ncbi:hypothetical protein CQW23_00064 [Capsicum baccatum]|uniref:AT-rich interactive domain-containing protein 2 n=1 Tax=Capsicum baccatum TaxID=33114 RepID=A0A2G2XK30_CAPBA|nr:hypothetical protein CQW23_00064 [Capsicum baccatum]